jgi:hypothetical protein
VDDDVFDLLDRIAELDEDYVEPGDPEFLEYQHAKTRFYQQIRSLEGAVDPDTVVDHMVDQDYEAVEEYLSQELRGGLNE